MRLPFRRKEERSRPALLALVADLHVNSTEGLMPDLSVVLDDGGMYYANKTQRFLLDAWRSYWQTIDRLQKQHQAELYIVVNGDIIDGDHHDTRQIITRNQTTMMRWAVDLLEPIAQKAGDNFFVTRGTESHSGKSAAWDEKVAGDLGARPNPEMIIDGKVAAWAWWHIKMEIRGIKFDIKHHTTRSKTPRSKGGSAGRLAADVQANYMDDGEWPPDFVIRSHVHVRERNDDHATKAYILPCWQGPTAYGHMLTKASGKTSIGGAYVVVNDGEILDHDWIGFPWKKTKWIKF